MCWSLSGPTLFSLVLKCFKSYIMSMKREFLFCVWFLTENQLRTNFQHSFPVLCPARPANRLESFSDAYLSISSTLFLGTMRCFAVEMNFSSKVLEMRESEGEEMESIHAYVSRGQNKRQWGRGMETQTQSKRERERKGERHGARKREKERIKEREMESLRKKERTREKSVWQMFL